MWSNLLEPVPTSEDNISVVLIQDAVHLRQVSASRVSVLGEDAQARSVTPAYPVISYGDLLRMIFDADCVVAL